jgi:uncharacterized protein (TIGR02246 family)
MTASPPLSSFGLLFAALASFPSAASPRHMSPRASYDFQTRKVEVFFRTRTQDESALSAVYTRDAILIEADGNVVRGRGAIARHFKKILASGAVRSFKVTTTTFRTDGRISYAGGYEDIEELSANGPRRARNRFVSLLRRDADGVWRFDYIMEAR